MDPYNRRMLYGGAGGAMWHRGGPEEEFFWDEFESGRRGAMLQELAHNVRRARQHGQHHRCAPQEVLPVEARGGLREERVDARFLRALARYVQGGLPALRVARVRQSARLRRDVAMVALTASLSEQVVLARTRVAHRRASPRKKQESRARNFIMDGEEHDCFVTELILPRGAMDSALVFYPNLGANQRF